MVARPAGLGWLREGACGPQSLWGCLQVLIFAFHHSLMLLHGGTFFGFRL
jgi:hypothetical protein